MSLAISNALLQGLLLALQLLPLQGLAWRVAACHASVVKLSSTDLPVKVQLTQQAPQRDQLDLKHTPHLSRLCCVVCLHKGMGSMADTVGLMMSAYIYITDIRSDAEVMRMKSSAQTPHVHASS